MQNHAVIMAAEDPRVHRTAQNGLLSTAAHSVVRVAGLVSWWDSFELWLSGRGFVLQTLLIMPVVLTLAYGIAVTSDAVLGVGIRVLRRLRSDRKSAR